MRPPGKAGFALPAVLVVVAMLALVFLAAAGSMRSLSAETLAAKQAVAFEQAARSLEARTAWLAATEPMGPSAILVGGPRAQSRSRLDPVIAPRRQVAPVFLDGRPYRSRDALGAVFVSLQDAAGQLNLNLMTDEGRTGVIAQLGVAAGERGRLAERWADWIDIDDLERLGGAERSDYAARGLTQPRNGPMTRVSEVLGVLGWTAAVPRKAWLGLRDRLTVDPGSADFNVNTASATALRIALDLTPQQAEAVGAARRQAPLVSLADLTRVIGPLPFDIESSYTRPNGRISLTVTAPGRKLVFRSRIVLTPDSPERPLWIEERAVSTVAEGSRAPADAPDFPDLLR